VQRRETGIGQGDPARLEKGVGFVEREAQVWAAQLVQAVRNSQAMQAQGRLLARREQEPELCRHPRDQQLQPVERVLGVELVQVVDHQVDRLRELLQLRH
jgi:hypothetical protein